MFVADRGGPTLGLFVSVAIAAAILNALIAILIVCARMLYSSARDLAWPEPVNRFLARVDPRTRTPWGAVAFLTTAGALLTPFVDVATLGTILGGWVSTAYTMIALCALWSRVAGGHRRPISR